jgi:hypothetical protein
MKAVAPSEIRDERLLAIARIAVDVGASEIADDARAAAARLDEGLFYVAVLGQFKRGKSTLINALAGLELLPTGVAPVTSVVTVVRHGTRRTARARYRDGSVEELATGALGSVVSEAENPGNRKGVVAVEVEVVSPLLQHGLSLADTPGLGSINAANTAETRQFLPHVDAAMLVVGADPPISGEELALLRDVAGQVRDVFVVLAKADRPSESEMSEARAFTERVLAEALPGRDVRIFEVSAREVLAADLPTRDWTRMTRALEELAQRDGADLVERAREREVRSLRTQLAGFLHEIEGALRRPVAETEQRVRILTESAKAADRAVMELRHLFNAEQQQIERDLDREREAFVAEVTPGMHAELVSAIGDHVTRASGLDLAQGAAEACISAWRAQVTPTAEQAFAAAADRFVSGASAIATRTRAASDIAGQGSLEIATALSARSRFYMRTLMTEASPSLASRIADRFRGHAARHAAAVRAAQAFAVRLVNINANGVVNDLAERMIESRRGIEAALRKHLNATATAAREAAARARTLQAAGIRAVEDELQRLAGLRAQLGEA